METTSVMLPLADMRDLLTGALVAAGKDDTMPMLAAVHVVLADGTLRAEGTDRYRLMVGTYTLPDGAAQDGAAFDVLLPRRDVEALLRSLPKPAPRSQDFASITVEGESVTVEGGAATLTIRALGATYPKVASIMPADMAPLSEGFHQITLDPKLLASFDKVPHIRNTGLRMIFTHEHKAVELRLSHDTITWRGLLMPQKTHAEVARTIPRMEVAS